MCPILEQRCWLKDAEATAAVTAEMIGACRGTCYRKAACVKVVAISEQRSCMEWVTAAAAVEVAMAKRSHTCTNTIGTPANEDI
jgi:hypothetical protein